MRTMLYRSGLAALAAIAMCSITGVQAASAVAPAASGPRASAAPTEPPMFPRPSVAVAGTAKSYGSTGNLLLAKELIDIVRTPTSRGYWLLAGDGGVFSYGDAHFYGSTGNLRLVAPAVQMATTKTGLGYWFVARDGGVFSFGDARFFGSMGGKHLNAPMVGMLPTSTGRGYWLVAADGGIFSFGDARFRGSLGTLKLSAPIVAAAPTVTNAGYWLIGQDGAVYGLGDALYRGRSERRTVDIASFPDGTGYAALSDIGWVETFRVASKPTLPQLRLDFQAGALASGLALTGDSRGEWVVSTGRAPSDAITTAQGRYSLLQRMHWNRCAPATWLLDPANMPSGGQAFAAELFDYVNRVTGMQFHFGGLVGAGIHIPDNTVLIQWIDIPTDRWGADVVGFGTPLQPNSGVITLSSEVTFWSWRAHSIGQVAIHEMGHALGLGDNLGDTTSIMDYNDVTQRFGDGDLAGLRTEIFCG